MNRKFLTTAAIVCLLTSCSFSTPFEQMFDEIDRNGMDGAKKVVAKGDAWKHVRRESKLCKGGIGLMESLLLNDCISLKVARYLVEQGAELCEFDDPYTASVCLNAITSRTWENPVYPRYYSPEEIIETLDCAIEHGAVVGTFPSGRSPLSDSYNAKVAEYWLAKGLNPMDEWEKDTGDAVQEGISLMSKKYSPLANAASYNFLDVFKLYVDAVGFDKLTEKDKGCLLFYTLTDCAIIARGYQKAKIEYLIQLGLDPTKYKDKYGRSVMELIADEDYSILKRAWQRDVLEKYIEEHGKAREEDMIQLPIWFESDTVMMIKYKIPSQTPGYSKR